MDTRVLPALVTGQSAVLGDELEVPLAPGSPMPPVLVAGNGDRALQRAAAYGDGWLSIALPPEDVAKGLAVLGGLAAQHGRPAPRPTVVGPMLDTDLGKGDGTLSTRNAVHGTRAIGPRQ